MPPNEAYLDSSVKSSRYSFPTYGHLLSARMPAPVLPKHWRADEDGWTADVSPASRREPPGAPGHDGIRAQGANR